MDHRGLLIAVSLVATVLLFRQIYTKTRQKLECRLRHFVELRRRSSSEVLGSVGIYCPDLEIEACRDSK